MITMKITSVQKVIKVGDSAGVTIPARDLKAAEIKVGDNVKISVESIDKKSDILVSEYEQFKLRYEQALKNLADR